MPPFLRRFWPYLALSGLAVVTAEPLTRAQMMCTDDLPFHLFRAVELGRLLELGHWFPRWAPHMAQGYGYPFFNFYAPLSSYVVVGLHWTGLAYPAALRLAFILTLWLAGVSACLFVRELLGERAGLAAGAAYLFAPYLAFDVLYRGNFAETLAFVWPPLVLYGLTRMKAEGGRMKIHFHPSAFSLTSILYAALILTHNVFALIASPLLFGYAALLAWQGRVGRWRVLAWAGLSLLAGVALAAYFWLPALVERGLVHSDRLLVPPIFTWYTNFSTARELLGPLPAFDPRLINPSPPRTVGLVTVLVGLPALAGMVTRPGRSRAGFATTTGFFAAALVGYCLLNLEVSAPIWRLIRPLELVQFPWRMLGPAALCAAVLVGASVVTLEDWLSGLAGPRAARWLPAVPVLLAVGVVAAGALPAWYATYCPSAPTAGVADLVLHEALTNTTGTTAKNEYLPRTVSRAPAGRDLAEALRAGEEPARLWLPADSGARVLSATPRDPLDATYTLAAAAETTAVYRQYYYPGWRVSLDGRPATLRVTPEEGLISFQVPPGTHTVRVTFGLTPLRAFAGAVSLVTLGGLGVVGVWRGRRRTKDEGRRRSEAGGQTAALTATPWPAILVVLLGCALIPAVKLGVVDRRAPLAPLAAAENPVSAQHPLLTDVAGGVRLYGYDVSATQVAGDSSMDVAWYAALRAPTQRRYWPTAVLEDKAGLTWSVLNALPPRWHREPRDTPEWGPDQYAQWARLVIPLPGTPPGEYSLYGWVFDRDSLEIASVLDEAGNAVAPRLLLETVTVTRPRQPFVLQPPHPAEQAFGPIRLLGYDLGRTAAAAGEALPLSLYWASEQLTDQDFQAQVSLVDSAGQPAFSVAVEPANGYPTRQWQPGDQWLGQTRLRLPAALPAGEYTLAVGVPGAADGQQALGTLRVDAPERSFAPLPFANASGAAFGDVGVLEGYTLTRGEAALSVGLAWRATGSPLVSYSVFVHLADSAGRVWAQSDAAPAGWTRPTTGWVAGEYVRDEHSLSLPPGLPAGDYTVWVGLYDPLTGSRVPASGPGAAEDQRVGVGTVSWP